MMLKRWPLMAAPWLLAACAQLPAPVPRADLPVEATPSSAPPGVTAGEFSAASLLALRPSQLRSTVGTAAQARERLVRDHARVVAAIGAAKAQPRDTAALREFGEALQLAAHYRIELESARPVLLATLPALDRQPPDVQRPLLTAAYTLYPQAAAPALRRLLPRLATPREFAIAAYTLMQSRQPADLALVQAQLQRRDERREGQEPRLIALGRALSVARGAPPPVRPPLADLLALRPGTPVVFSFQRPGRQQMGLALVRQADGRFVRRPDGGLFHVQQLGLSRSGLPGTLTLGNTPQGLFAIHGAGRAASNVWIGATPYLHSKAPVEASVAEFEHRAAAAEEPAWSLERYQSLLPASWRDYTPMQEVFLAGSAGRDEMLAHGSTADPRHDAGAAYFPGTPASGCLVAMEYWAADGTLIHSDQLALLQAFMSQGVDRGYLVVVELDAGSTAVSLAEVVGAVRDAEDRLGTGVTAAR